jgi:hypothetical protein
VLPRDATELEENTWTHGMGTSEAAARCNFFLLKKSVKGLHSTRVLGH